MRDGPILPLPTNGNKLNASAKIWWDLVLKPLYIPTALLSDSGRLSKFGEK